MSSLTNAEYAKRKQAVLDVAMNQGNKWGAAGFVLAGAATVAATLRSKKFDQMTSVSAKASIPIMAGIGLWSFKFEMTVYEAQVTPEKWGFADVVETPKFISRMPWHHKTMNYIYDHPFQMISVLATPLVGSIAFTQSHNTHLTFSQKVMHSRVFAQAGVLTILLTTMAFREYMDRNGRFQEPGTARHGIEPSYAHQDEGEKNQK